MEYIGSEKHRNNVLKMRVLGLNKIQENKNERIKEYNLTPNRCSECHNVLNYEKRKNKFCSSNCSATYNNKNRVLSDNTKRKIGDSINRYNVNNPNKQKAISCVMCGSEFYPKRSNSGRLSKSTTCSKLCSHELRSNKSKIQMKKRIADGKHKGWISRNVISYPEKFFIEVLKNNNIKYIHNYPVKQSDLGLESTYNYFLDFYIENKNIDLEIDGQQHDRRKNDDMTRDAALISCDYNVYRIKWRNINTVNGKENMKKEIEKFLDYYNSINY
jgi:very-short-patch-repair endonuclease